MKKQTVERLHIIDTIGPFVVNDNDEIINWSKVKFSNLETKNRLPPTVTKGIIKRFRLYIQKVSDLGYDSVSIDDLAHMVSLPFYNPTLQLLIEDYRTLYRQLFEIAKQYDVKIFINTDYLFYNEDIRRYLKEGQIKPKELFKEIVQKAFTDFPEISGIILRIGETDGTDVKDRFISKLTIRTPVQANKLIRKILPVFEKTDKLLIFRTWTIGAYKVGDLLWNEQTFDTVFSSIDSPSLIISMKFGDTDFMRYLSLNPLFFHSPHKKIIELQTRREWEGMGTYPSFVGWDYADYLSQLANNTSIVGIHVWCQTGGWAKKAWSNTTYLENSSFWNELNTEVTVNLYRNNMSVEAAIAKFSKNHSISNNDEFTKLLELSEIAIKKGLYITGLAEHSYYFRRTRVPTLMWLTWDKPLFQSAVIGLIRTLTPHPQVSIQESEEALRAVEQMIVIARNIKLPKEVQASLDFQLATFTQFVELRRYLLTSMNTHDLAALNRSIKKYTSAYPQHYSIPKLIHLKRRRRLPKRLAHIFLRETILYRKRDRIILATTALQRKALSGYLRRSKSHLVDQSMGVDTLIR